MEGSKELLLSVKVIPDYEKIEEKHGKDLKEEDIHKIIWEEIKKVNKKLLLINTSPSPLSFGLFILSSAHVTAFPAEPTLGSNSGVSAAIGAVSWRAKTHSSKPTRNKTNNNACSTIISRKFIQKNKCKYSKKQKGQTSKIHDTSLWILKL